MNARVTGISMLLASSLMLACSDNDNDNDNASAVDAGNGDVTGGNGDATNENGIELRRFTSADDFGHALRDALVNNGPQYGHDNAFPAVDAGEATGDVGSDSADSDSTGAAVASPSGSSPDGSASNVTATNVQEQGVDEADRVKVSADGSTLYVLHVDQQYLPIEIPVGTPVETTIVTDDGVFPGGGTLNATNTLRVMSLDPATPDAAEVGRTEIDVGGKVADGFYQYDADTLVLTASGGFNYYADWGNPFAFVQQNAEIVSIDVSSPSSPSLATRLSMEGQLVSSRRIGSQLVFATRYYPNIEGVDASSMSAEAWQQAVNEADLADIMPTWQRDGGEAQPLARPDDCFAAPSSTSESWYSPDIITMGVIDLDSMTLTDSVCYLGSSETLYASTDSIVLATTQWDYDDGGLPETDPDDVVTDNDGEPATADTSDLETNSYVSTELHQFNLGNGTLDYVGSGSVNGHLGWNSERRPYRMSMRDGLLRVATMIDPWNGLVESPIRLTVLEADGNGSLNTVAQLPSEAQPAPIGKPGESLYASRFVGDRAYLVTYLQSDPLYVIDFADPRNPRLRGELQVEGFSDYLHPLDNDFLLGIGMDAVAGDEERGGILQGMKLSLVDVRDLDNPAEVQVLRIGQRGTSSEALSNPRAITVQTGTDSQPTRVAFGIDVYGSEAGEYIGDPWSYPEWSRTALYGFEVSTGDNAAITLRGSMAAGDGVNNPGYGDARSVMVDDAVFYIHDENVYAADWDDLGNVNGPRQARNDR